MHKVKGKLVLKDGSVYEGDLYGNRNAVGEVVFTTGMSGYQETLTDPSFCDQIVVMTYPLVGNYGCCKLFDQSDKCWYQGFIVSELCDEPSNWRSEETLPDFLERMNVPVLVGVDTRAITRKIRSYGTLQGVIVPSDMPQEKIDGLLATPEVHDQVAKVTTPRVYTMGEGKYHVAVLDYGIKRNILRSLIKFDCRLTVFPAETPAEQVLAVQPDGIFLSNGPGDPEDLQVEIANIKKMMGKKPIFGICMGHQVMGLANGAKTKKMLFGHRGINQPVKDLVENKVVISSQNHGFMVDEDSLKGINVEITNRSLNDGTIEGLKYLDHPSFSVQYHPEASPGPSGHEYLFERFIKMMGGR
jgi:carbamoyl-phosphate synthase small subunit